MSADGIWWFYKVDAAKFEAVQSEFELAIERAPALPEVFIRPQREGQVYDGLWLNVMMGNDPGIGLYHKPFEAIVDRIIFHQFNEGAGLLAMTSWGCP